MPELPEVETMRRGILGVVGARHQGCRTRRLRIAGQSPSRHASISFAAALWGANQRRRPHRQTGCRPFGFRDAIVLEPRMTGLVLVADPPTQEHLRFRCTPHRRQSPGILYWDRRGLGSVRLISPDEFEKAFGPGKIGPDALAMTADLFRERLGASKRPVKVAMLDQHAVAGIGNLYASEILHLCQIHPARRCDKITRTQWQTIADATQTILESAIRYEGSTLGDGTYRNAFNKEGGYQNHHRVYDRAGDSCSRCGDGRRSPPHCPGPTGDLFLPELPEKVKGQGEALRRANAGFAQLCLRRRFRSNYSGTATLQTFGWEERICHGPPHAKPIRRTRRTIPECDCCHDEHADRRLPRREFLTAGGAVLGCGRDRRSPASRPRLGASEERDRSRQLRHRRRRIFARVAW